MIVQEQIVQWHFDGNKTHSMAIFISDWSDWDAISITNELRSVENIFVMIRDRKNTLMISNGAAQWPSNNYCFSFFSSWRDTKNQLWHCRAKRTMKMPLEIGAAQQNLLFYLRCYAANRVDAANSQSMFWTTPSKLTLVPLIASSILILHCLSWIYFSV